MHSPAGLTAGHAEDFKLDAADERIPDYSLLSGR
jgi:hypothetical protein